VDDMMQLYMEETEDMLQKAEECIIRLETEYSSLDVNELFRIAHTIKGSSHMVGYEDIGNVMHKIEDMLDCARNGSIPFDQSIVSLCFHGLDTVKNMLLYKNEQGSKEIMDSIENDAAKIKEMVEVFIIDNKKEIQKTIIEVPEVGIVSSYLNKGSKGDNKYFITFIFEEDAPMVSPVILMILNSVQGIGKLIYSSIGDDYFSDNSGGSDIKTFEIIISTDVDEAELYTYFTLFYIEKINIVDLSRSVVAQKDYSFIDDDNNLYLVILKAFMKLYKTALNLSVEFNINSEDIHQIRSLHCLAINEFGKMKNNDKMEIFITDFNELYRYIIKIYEDQVDVDEDICSSILTRVVELIERAYNYTKGRHIFSIFKSEGDNFIGRLRNFVEMLNKTSTLILLIDLSKCATLGESEVKHLIDIKKEIESQNIELGIIANGPFGRRTINIFDSIKPVVEFNVFKSELHGILSIFDSEAFLEKVSDK